MSDIVHDLISAIKSAYPDIPDDALAEAEASIRQQHGGCSPYVCKVDPDRSHKVLRDFNGRNRNEVCKLYKISRSQFYAILKGQ